MLEIILLSTFILGFALIIYKEYRNNKKYNEERNRYKNRKSPSLPKEGIKQTTVKTPTTKTIPTEKIVAKEESKSVDLPVCNYPPFDHARTVAMGLSEDEAKEFVLELISQVRTQIPLIQEAIDAQDFHKQERLTHSIKGSATNLGTGGISDLLKEYNTYLKTGNNTQISQAYFEYLKAYYEKLTLQYN